MHRYLEYRSQFETISDHEERLKNGNQTNRDNRRVLKSQAGKEYLYVFGNLLSQGN
jgi:hypothetical protein